MSNDQADLPRCDCKDESHSTSENATPLYRPLLSPNAMRTVVLKAGSPQDPIECSLVHVEGDDKPQPYEALSYEWGQPSEDDPLILVDGRSFRIRANLFHALQQIRYYQDRSLWIDSLCINQADIKERGHQVQKMGWIYREAESVIAWLGLSPDHTAFAQEILHDSTKRRCWCARLKKEQQCGYCAVVFKLCERSYWTRAWVQQEIYLAKTIIVYCGTFRTDEWRIVQSLNGFRFYERMRLPAAAILENRGLVSISGTLDRKKSHPLREWLEMAFKIGLDTSEPRDFVYALLGVSADERDDVIIPDYEKPLLDVYLETIRFCHCFASPDKYGNRHFRMVLAHKLGLKFNEEMKALVKKHMAMKYERQKPF